MPIANAAAIADDAQAAEADAPPVADDAQGAVDVAPIGAVPMVMTVADAEAGETAADASGAEHAADADAKTAAGLVVAAGIAAELPAAPSADVAIGAAATLGMLGAPMPAADAAAAQADATDVTSDEGA